MTTNTTTPSREEMINAIEKVVANKELSFGCRLKGRIDMFFDVPEDFIVINVPYGDEVIISGYDPLQDDDEIQDYEVFKFHIIGHPVMIGDVMDFIERNFPDGIHCIECKKGKILSDNFNDDTIFYCDNEDCEFLSKFYGDEAFCHNMELYDGFWEEKRKPITEQSDECVKFVYNLISE